MLVSLTPQVSAAATGRRRARRHWPYDPVEIGVPTWITVNRHVLRDVELQPLEVAEQHDGVVAHIGQVASRRRRAVEVRIDHDVRLLTMVANILAQTLKVHCTVANDQNLLIFEEERQPQKYPVHKLPKLAASNVMLYSKVSDSARLAALRTLAAAFRGVAAK